MTPELEKRLTLACKRALAVWGFESQARMLQEECGELIAEINRYGRDRSSLALLANEVADVLITLKQARIVIGPDIIDAAVDAKLLRLEQRLAEAEGKR